jgi:hypothetical protein
MRDRRRMCGKKAYLSGIEGNGEVGLHGSSFMQPLSNIFLLLRWHIKFDFVRINQILVLER